MMNLRARARRIPAPKPTRTSAWRNSETCVTSWDMKLWQQSQSPGNLKNCVFPGKPWYPICWITGTGSRGLASEIRMGVAENVVLFGLAAKQSQSHASSKPSLAGFQVGSSKPMLWACDNMAMDDSSISHMIHTAPLGVGDLLKKAI